MSQSKRVFFSAEWRDLVMLNYDVEPSLLRRFVPPGTVLDSFKGRTYISLVGFRFCHTKLLGCFPVPFFTQSSVGRTPIPSSPSLSKPRPSTRSCSEVLVGPRLSVDLPYGYS